MGLNLAVLMNGAGAVAKATTQHPITKGGSLAALITGCLYAAAAAGVAIPEIAFTAGPIAGYLLYKMLPVKTQQVLDDTAQEVVDTITTIPNVYAEYPNHMPIGTPNNLNQKS